MKYPTIPQFACERIAKRRWEGEIVEAEPDTTWVGNGEFIDLEPLIDLAADLKEAVKETEEDIDRDQFEGQYSIELFNALADVPAEVLDDRGFWSYLSLEHFWEFIAWREEEPFAKGNYLKYVDGRDSSEAVLNRMYLRAKAVGSGHADLAGAVRRSGDFWRSHIIRVKTGTAPAVTRAFVRMQRDERMMTGELRDFAKKLNRTWTNVVPYLYDDEAAADLLGELRAASDLVDASEPI